MKELSGEDATVIILLVGEASGVFAGFCPSWFTVASPFFHEQEAKEGNVNRIRAGEAAASAIVLATGWAVSKRGHRLAFYASILITLIFIIGYEYQILNPSKKSGSSGGKKSGGCGCGGGKGFIASG